MFAFYHEIQSSNRNIFFFFQCKSNGACGCCGCRAKAKARAASTNHVNGDDFVETDDGNIFGLAIWNKTDIKVNDDNVQRLTNPNHLFHLCCEERRLPPGCIQKCHFNIYNKEVLEAMFVGSDECPLDYLPEMQFCAAQGKDHRKCCAGRGVAETAAGQKCLTFCDQTPDVYTPIDYSYAPCLDRFEDMKRCFYDDIRSSARQHFLKLLNI
ncbi:unnamed protein product [Caenorhabditis auriculariae]|uniref:Domain of unknown function DB domain-containing protein n=1 Tax=Caenorhabditis auriculariae TaxID=2777116 RepID=A0A8S1HI74_9PELO|nr:unnamed protein product [Caenorhabditis auriculariae]